MLDKRLSNSESQLLPKILQSPPDDLCPIRLSLSVARLATFWRNFNQATLAWHTPSANQARSDHWLVARGVAQNLKVVAMSSRRLNGDHHSPFRRRPTNQQTNKPPECPREHHFFEAHFRFGAPTKSKTKERHTASRKTKRRSPSDARHRVDDRYLAPLITADPSGRRAPTQTNK